MRKMGIRHDYRHTLYASYLGSVTQAIVNNLAPLLFLTFQKTYGISLDQIALLVTVNFGVQLAVDLLAARYVDRIGYRTAVVTAHVMAAAGLAGLGILPDLWPGRMYGLLLAVVVYAVGGGLIEVLISPIVEACPTEEKSSAMSLLHSFYCWGTVLVIIASTLFFRFAGIGRWRLLAVLWALIPLCNAAYYRMVPINRLVGEEEGLPVRKLCSMKLFWIFMVLMVCSGASEQAMSQWASAFAEAGLKVSKTVGDLAGPCFFSVLMGGTRVFYARYSAKLELSRFLFYSGVLCILGYLLAVFAPIPALSLAGCGLCGLSVGILWPGTFSLASEACPMGGTAMFALFALAGDLGCAVGPGLVGVVSGALGGDLRSGLLCAILFPALLIMGVLALRRELSVKNAENVR